MWIYYYVIDKRLLLWSYICGHGVWAIPINYHYNYSFIFPKICFENIIILGWHYLNSIYFSDFSHKYIHIKQTLSVSESWVKAPDRLHLLLWYNIPWLMHHRRIVGKSWDWVKIWVEPRLVYLCKFRIHIICIMMYIVMVM